MTPADKNILGAMMKREPAEWSNAGIRAERDRLREQNAELVAALRKMLSEHDIISEYGSTGTDNNSLKHDRWPETAKMARAALAKAQSCAR